MPKSGSDRIDDEIDFVVVVVAGIVAAVAAGCYSLLSDTNYLHRSERLVLIPSSRCYRNWC